MQEIGTMFAFKNRLIPRDVYEIIDQRFYEELRTRSMTNFLLVFFAV